jgi:putative transposase
MPKAKSILQSVCMVLYRRFPLESRLIALTLCLQDRNSRLLVEQFSKLAGCLKRVKRKYSFKLIAWVVLPDHMHLVIQLPLYDNRYSLRIGLFKECFTRSIVSDGFRPEKRENRQRALWQRRFWEHQIRDEEDLRNHIHYIHNNPVKHGYVESAEDWNWSSLWRYKRLGLA